MAVAKLRYHGKTEPRVRSAPPSHETYLGPRSIPRTPLSFPLAATGSPRWWTAFGTLAGGMSNQVEKLKNAEQTWRKHAENCGQKCLSTLILIYFPLMGLKLANWSSHLLWDKCEVVCELCILMRSPHTFVCVYLRHRAFCLGRTPFDQNNIPQSSPAGRSGITRRITTWFQAVTSYEWSTKSYAPSPLLSTFCRVLTTCSPIN